MIVFEVYALPTCISEFLTSPIQSRKWSKTDLSYLKFKFISGGNTPEPLLIKARKGREGWISFISLFYDAKYALACIHACLIWAVKATGRYKIQLFQQPLQCFHRCNGFMLCCQAILPILKILRRPINKRCTGPLFEGPSTLFTCACLWYTLQVVVTTARI